MENTKKLEHLRRMIDELASLEENLEINQEIKRLQSIAAKLEREIAENYSAWDKVQIARMIDRPRGSFYIQEMVTDFIELHGDRNFKDDKAIIGGIGKIGNHVVTIIAQNKGKSAKENVERNLVCLIQKGIVRHYALCNRHRSLGGR